ncbi:hypothetical protein [uncultured Cohaesibacter sp.]|uniref:hypothetical protein n=1 Tax=uncultured Cohaesibacter sp. TaxID=1002546 RepID=UPI0029C923F0|nr:hypothetical protein [uncultured Cohaesibacter sp.]
MGLLDYLSGNGKQGGGSLWDTLSSGITNGLDDNRQMMRMAGLASVLGADPNQMLQSAMLGSGMDDKRKARTAADAQRNKTLGYLQNNRPDLAAQVDAGLPISEAFKMLNQKPEARRIIQGADGFNYFEDGNRVLPNVQKPPSLQQRRIINGPDGRPYYEDGAAVLPSVAAQTDNKTFNAIKARNPNMSDDEIWGAIATKQAGEYLKPQAPQYRQLTGQQAQKLGLNPQNAYNLGPDGKISQIGGGGTNVTVNNTGENSFQKGLGTGTANMFVELGSDYNTAVKNRSRLDRLEGYLAHIDTGAGAAFKKLAGDFGINSEGLSEIQAATALINSMVPEMRPIGSGQTSDRDMELFKQSAPRLINTPDGNALVMDTLKGLNELQMQQGRIGQLVMAGQMTREQAIDALQKLPDPLAKFTAAMQRTGVDRGAAIRNKYGLE